ncbi:MAG TPA: hypothetical protein VGP02_03800 [Mycobacteriales bacterium]|jgi:hypothetical protein|nr:hypothetical protein [Mycobacteriales bacterium]
MKIFSALLAALATLSGVLVGASPVQAAPAPLYGNDVSWPQCPKSGGVGYSLPMPDRSSTFVVIGLTRGRGFVANPCLGWQVQYAKDRHLYTAAYAFTTFPTSAQLRKYHGSAKTAAQRLRNVGAAQARFNVATMRRAGLHSPIVWIDVEPSGRQPWSKNTTHNAALVQGAVHGYQKAGLKVGFYSTTHLWRTIVGRYRTGLPEWRTAGRRGRAIARQRCVEAPFQGGTPVLAQWYTSSVDHDITCPGYATRKAMRQYFRKY